MAEPKLLAACVEADFENHHALVYGRVRVWNRAPSDNHELPWRWSKMAWWKAMYYPHRGPPAFTGAWGIYAGGNDGYTGPGDAELTHLLPMPPVPGVQGNHNRLPWDAQPGCYSCGRRVDGPCTNTEGCEHPPAPAGVSEPQPSRKEP